MKTSIRIPWYILIPLIIVLGYIFLEQQFNLKSKNSQIQQLRNSIGKVEDREWERNAKKNAILKQLLGEEALFTKIDESDIWETISLNKPETAAAITKTVHDCGDLHGCMEIFISQLCLELAKVDFSEHPANNYDDDEIRSRYQSLDRDFKKLNIRIKDEFRIFINNPTSILVLVNNYGDNIIRLLPSFTLAQTRILFKEAKRLYDLAQNQGFKGDMKTYLAYEAAYHKNPKRNDYQKKAETHAQKMESKWHAEFKEQQAIYRHFSQRPEEWKEVFNLVEKKLFP